MEKVKYILEADTHITDMALEFDSTREGLSRLIKKYNQWESDPEVFNINITEIVTGSGKPQTGFISIEAIKGLLA